VHRGRLAPAHVLAHVPWGRASAVPFTNFARPGPGPRVRGQKKMEPTVNRCRRQRSERQRRRGLRVNSTVVGCNRTRERVEIQRLVVTGSDALLCVVGAQLGCFVSGSRRCSSALILRRQQFRSRSQFGLESLERTKLSQQMCLTGLRPHSADPLGPRNTPPWSDESVLGSRSSLRMRCPSGRAEQRGGAGAAVQHRVLAARGPSNAPPRS
jgi:hypothetical protein